jgi:hypothetical protein
MYLFLIAGILAMLNYSLVAYNNWSYEYGLQKPWVFNLEFYLRSFVYDRPEPTIVSPIVEVIEQSDIDINNPVDQKIYDLWGDRYFLLARSVFKCESGLKEDAVNWGSKDIGIAQINWPTWETRVKEEFGYTLKDMFDVDKNLEVAYWIWDRDGDGHGSFEPWVVFQNGNFVGCVD